jgi:hypothetical protein
MYEIHTPYVPDGKSEILDYLMSMMLGAPKFEDDSGYFPYNNIDTEFQGLNEGLRRIRKRLGEEKYVTLADMAAQMEVHFRADPSDEGQYCMDGRELILDMIDILKGKTTKADTGE